MSWGMFCAIPVPYKDWDESCTNLIIPFFPIVGLFIGLLWYGGSMLLHLAGLRAMMLSAFLMLFPYVITGFLHVDGFMDTSDAILSYRPLEEKFKILKDPHTGAFAVVSVLVLFIICFVSAYEVTSDVSKFRFLMLIPVVSRSLTGLALLSLKIIPQSGYGSYFKKNAKTVHKISLVFTGFLAVTAMCFLSAEKGLIVATAIISGFFLSILWAYRQLNGISGDVSGYALTVSEACGLIALALI